MCNFGTTFEGLTISYFCKCGW